MKNGWKNRGKIGVRSLLSQDVWERYIKPIEVCAFVPIASRCIAIVHVKAFVFLIQVALLGLILRPQSPCVFTFLLIF